MKFLFGLCLLFLSSSAYGKETHVLSFHGATARHSHEATLSYVNPKAPKGGKITLATLGTYDSLNPFIMQGTPAVGLLKLGNFFFYESLMMSALDDQFSAYCHLAESVDLADDNSQVIFRLRKNVTFHDGSNMTADDVVFSFNILRQKADPFIKAYYRDIESPEKLGRYKVKFKIKNPENKELAMLLGQLPVLCKKFWEKRDFQDTLLTPPLSTGPYTISEIKAGNSITYKRNPNYWGRDLPKNQGRWNFDEITFDYYRDTTLTLQAFLAGESDFKSESKPTDWFERYKGPTFISGYHVKREIAHKNPAGGYGLFFNLRRPQFQNPKVRQALSLLFDFEWIQKNIFQGKFKRTRSYFQNTELAATGLPKGQELDILTPFKTMLPAEVFTQEFNPPKTDGTGNIRPQIRQALKLFKQAGYISKDGKLIQNATKKQLEIEILTLDPFHQRVFMPFIANMQKLGIDATIRIVDSAQYEARMDSFDFDMTNPAPFITFSPGNEQRDQWGSIQANKKGSMNKGGMKNKVVDALINQIIAAPDRPTLVATTRALDRVLQWQYASIPLYHNSMYWVAYKDRFDYPKTPPEYGLGFFDTWWIDPAKDKAFRIKHMKAEG